MITEIHYFCFGLYISNWKVFLLPTSHLWLLFFPTCNNFPSKVLTCLVTVYFSNVRLGTGGCAGPPPHAVQLHGPALPCQDSPPALTSVLGGCWQLGGGAKLRCSHDAGGREALDVPPGGMGLWEKDARRQCACGKLTIRTSWEGGRKGRRDQLNAAGSPVYLW